MRVVKNSVRALSRPVRTQLDNGAVVVTQKTGQACAAVGLISKGGSRAEVVSGSASLNRSVTLNNLNAGAGVNVSSYVHRERTGVFGVTLPGQASEFASNLVAAANAREVTDGAREHAQAALNSASANPKVVVDDYLHMAGFQCTPLAASPFGTSAGIGSGSAADHLAYRARQYAGDNAVIVGAGAVDHDALCEAAAALSPHELTVGPGPISGNCQFTGSSMHDRNDYIKNCYVKWGYNVPGADHPNENVAFAVMAEVFGAWKRGDQHAQFAVNPLVQWVADNTPGRRIHHGGHNNPWRVAMLNEFQGELTTYSDTALFGFFTEVVDADSGNDDLIHNNRLQAITYKMQGEIKRWSSGFSDHEVAAAKNRLLVKLSDQLANPLSLADNLGTQATLSGSARTFASYQQEVEQITAQKLSMMFDQYIYNQEIVMTYYGATEGAPEPQQARNRGWDLLPF